MAGFGPTNSYETYTVEGMREDLGPVIYNIDPVDTPGMNSISRGKMGQVMSEWQTDSLDTAGFNAVDESNETAFDAVPVTVRPHNIAQISEKSLALSGTIQAVELAGRQAELGYQLARLAKSLKRDCEFTIMQNQFKQAGGVAGAQVRQLASFECWITGVNANRASDGADAAFDGNGSPANGATGDPTDGTQRALQEGMLLNVIQECWTAGGDINLIMTGPYNKRVISSFAGNSTRFDIGEDQRLTAAIAIYISDYGEHRIVANRFSRDRSVLCIDTKYWAMAYLRPFREKPLAETGDSTKRMMNVEYSLFAYNAKSSGVVADLTTA